MTTYYKIKVGPDANIWIPETNEVILAGEENKVPVPQEVVDRNTGNTVFTVLGTWEDLTSEGIHGGTSEEFKTGTQPVHQEPLILDEERTPGPSNRTAKKLASTKGEIPDGK